MKKVLWLIVCLMTMVIGVNAHNVHYPTYTEDGITYVKNGTNTVINGVRCEPWDVLKVDKPNSRTITIPSMVSVNGEDVHVVGIREKAFCACASLDSLIISDGVWIQDNTFVGCNSLTYLCYSSNGFRNKDCSYFGLSCKVFETSNGVGEDGFWKNIATSLEKLIITSTGTFHNRMDYCKNLKTIVCYSENPPYTQAAHSVSTYIGGCYVSFESWQWSTITLYVPRESLEKYYFDRVWGEIDNIYALNETPTTSTNNASTSINFVANSVTEDDVWYSLNGTKVDKPTKGVYIKNGKKYVIK